MTNCSRQKEKGMSPFFKGLKNSQQKVMGPESASPGSASHVEHIFSAIFNLSFSEEVFVSFMI